jgi:hypothetical protein
MTSKLNKVECWYEIDPRPGPEIRTVFEANSYDLESHKDIDFQIGQPVLDWKGIGWFAASEQEMEGPLEDVLRTSNLLPVFSERLKIALEDNHVMGMQFLPVKVYNSARRVLASYFLVNILNAIHALNEPQSIVKRTSVKLKDGTVKEWISWISKPVFYRSRLAGHDIVNLPGYFNAIYVSSRFKDLFNAGSFTGIGFLPIGLSDD